MFCVRAIFSHLRVGQMQSRIIVPLQRVVNFNQFVIRRNFNSVAEEDESEIIINDLCKGDHTLEKKLRILMLEVEVMRQDGRCAPDKLLSKHWQHLMNLESRNQRSKYLLYLFKTEKAKENEKVKKEARKKELEVFNPEQTKEFADDILYGIQHQSLFLRIRDQSMNNFDNYRALQALMHSQPIILDCSYEEHMVHKEILNAAKQLTYVFGDNRIHKDPFGIHLCNVNLEGPLIRQFRTNVPSLDEPWFPMHIHSKSYTEIFPKEKLVYLTPHCREELTKFDTDAIYIVGCMVDKVNIEPLSLAKAKRDGLKMAKLPLDRYLEWAPGSKKNLNINHMIPILLDLKLTKNWEIALKHIPRRKLMETKIMAYQKKLKNPKLRNAVYKSFSNMGFKDKRNKMRKSLYYDDHKL